MFNENRFYVYLLVDPTTDIPFYVGKGCDGRCSMHVQEAKRPINKQINPTKCQIINNILSSGHEIKIEKVQEHMQEQEAFNLETTLIKKYKRLKDGGCLSNISEGGDISGNKQNMYKRIFCYTLQGEYIEEFASQMHAAENKCIHKSTICSAVNGRSGSAGGFIWSYTKLPSIGRKTCKNLTSVNMFDLEGRFIQGFPSITTAAAVMGFTFTSIVECADPENTNRHTTGGMYRWCRTNGALKPLPKSPSFYKRKRIKGISPSKKIFVFENINDAHLASSANKTGIVDCCAGRKKTSGGWEWEYDFTL